MVLFVHNFYKSTHLGGEDHVFRVESDRALVYEVHNDRASLLKIVLHLLFPFYHALKIRSMVKKNKVDVVHLHNDFPMLTLWIFRFLRDLSCVRIQTLHNYRHWCANGILYRDQIGICHLCIEKKSRLPALINRCYRKSFLQSALVAFAYWIQDLFLIREEVDAFFCLSEHQKEKLLSFGVDPKKLILKPNAVFSENELLAPLSKKEIGIIYVGRIEESKGILKVLREVNSSILSQITVVGYAENLDELRSRFPQVNFVGKKPHGETMELIRKSRYLLHSSLCYETFGLTIIEAMALGTPVLGFPIGTRLDFIQQGVNGFIIGEKQIQKDIELALSVGDYPKLQKSTIQFSKAYAKENIVKKQMAVYQELLARKKMMQND